MANNGPIQRWQWVSQVPIRGGDGALLVNWCDVPVTHEESGQLLYHNSRATHHTLAADNGAALCDDGHRGWKMENEGINVLKRKGTHVEPNFGHGSQHLAEDFMVLNLLVFLLHTALHLVSDLYRLWRRALHTRATLFNDLRALCRYYSFPDWNSLWLFMIKALDEDDVPPTIAARFSN